MKYLFTTLIFSTLSLFTGCISETEEDVVNRVKVGDEVPSFGVVSADGVSGVDFEPSSFVGRRTVIAFFQSTCGDCRREMPKVYYAWQYFAENPSDPDILFLCISRGEDTATVGDYWRSVTDTKPSFEGMPYYLDPDRLAYNQFANSYVPRLYLIGTDGRVKYMAIETFDFDGAGLIEKINDLQ